MTGLNLVRERALALFFLALVAFSPALLAIFSRPDFLFGVPLLYLYLFGVWGLVIACVALNAFPRDQQSAGEGISRGSGGVLPGRGRELGTVEAKVTTGKGTR